MESITKISKWGSSLGMRIPKQIAGVVGISEGDMVELTIIDDSIVVSKRRTYRTIDELFDGHEGDYDFKYIDFGKPEGKELW
jgi:antitoxin MazE